MEDSKEGNIDRQAFKEEIRKRTIKDILWSKRRATSSKQILHHEMIEEEDKEVKLEESQKGYLPLSQNQKHHYHHRKEKKKKCWKCYSCNHLKRNFPYLRCFYCGFSSSFYSDKSYMLYPYTINEIIKDKYMVINILY